MLKWKSDDARMRGGDNAGSLSLLTTGFKSEWSRDTTPADIIACLRANPEAAAEVIDALRPLSVEVSGSTWVRKPDLDAAEARAEQAERRLRALNYQVSAHGCAASGVGERTYSCRADTLCGLCSLRHKAEQAERERDEARDTAALDEIRAQQRLESLAHDHAKAVAERDEARAERKRLSALLDDWISAASSFGRVAQEPTPDRLRQAIEQAEALRAQLAKTEAVVDAVRSADIAAMWIYDALRALDSPVGAGTDSGGSGAASNPGEAASAIGDNGPEPAGSSPRAIVDSDTAAVGAVDSTPGTPGLASREPGDAGSNPVRSGSSGTPGPTVGAIPAAGAKCGARECDDPPPADATKAGGGRCGEWLPAAGKGCALPRGHAGIHDPWQPGEPDPEAPATRREVEELRRRVERLEQLTGFAPKE